ncbi:MAG TPA: cytochrome c [Blastocatellia bacterium]|nr:cytochrome c [Blastocatellia bacterium]
MNKKTMTLATIVVSIAAMLGWALAPGTALAGQKNERGRKLFNQYCATCHGATGKGEGPVAAALKVGPPDLTAIQQPGEKFPFNRVQTKIDGEKAVTAHGPSKMPVWGTIFRRTSSEIQQQGDVYALVKYIESIQRLK